MTDKYTKFMLTVIATCLLVITFKITIPGAQAFGSGQDVRVTNFETDIGSGETLFVHCVNCE